MTTMEPGTRRFTGIMRRVAGRVGGALGEMNYSQQRALELYLGLDERRR